MEPYDIKIMLTTNGFWYTYWYLTGRRYCVRKYALWLMWVAYWAKWPDHAP
jgi:hypothetical protein